MSDLDPLLKRLHLANARRTWKSLVERAEKEQWTYESLLQTLFAEEIAHRRGTRLNRAVRVAQPGRGLVHQHEVVDVAHVLGSAQAVLNELVERVEVDVGEELAAQVADRQPSVRLRIEQALVRRH